jgi:hypothetical protein
MGRSGPDYPIDTSYTPVENITVATVVNPM